MKCKICEHRKSEHDRLDRIVKSEGEYEREKRRTNVIASDGTLMHKGVCESLQECPGCNGIMGSITHFEWTTEGKEIRTHIHICQKCKLKLPKESDKTFDGDWVNDSLE